MADRPRCARTLSALTLVAAAAAAGPAPGDDLVVDEVQVIQAVQYCSTTLIGDNVTWVRVLAGTDSPFGTPNVDAVLAVEADGAPVPGSPFHSLNGPLGVGPDPQFEHMDDTLNFLFVPPVTEDVVFTVEVNPLRTVAEPDYENNVAVIDWLRFECRDVVHLAYVPIDYTFDGSGVPDPAHIEPGIGDGFVRAIFSVGEWNYYENPLPTFTWDQNVNSSDVELLNALQDLRLNQLPRAGYPQPDFIYGWLAGNPYDGNGRAIGIPGDTAFGNTELIRHQRTFAHELGHLLGLSHNNFNINTIGLDVEHHLADTQGLDQLFDPDRKDVMVAGQHTDEAFVNASTYATVLADDRVQCGAAAAAPPRPCLRACGAFDSARRSAQLDPVTWIGRATPTASNPAGDLIVRGIDGEGRGLVEIRVRADTTCPLCVETGAAHTHEPRGPFHVLLPVTVDGRELGGVEIIDGPTGRVLARRDSSASVPAASFDYVGPAGTRDNAIGAAAREPLAGRIRVEWSGADDDGDELGFNLLYSFDGGQAWLPLALNRAEPWFEFDSARVPSSRGGRARLRLVASDGFNNTLAEVAEMWIGLEAPPAVHLFTPNDGAVVKLAAPVALHGSAWDREDGMLEGGQIEWHSSLDGELGTGRLLAVDSLSVGTHVITMTATDTSSASASDEVTIEVRPRDVFDADVDDDGTVDVDDLVAMITAWGDCPPGGPDACPADVTGDGTVDVDDLIEVISNWS